MRSCSPRGWADTALGQPAKLHPLPGLPCPSPPTLKGSPPRLTCSDSSPSRPSAHGLIIPNLKGLPGPSSCVDTHLSSLLFDGGMFPALSPRPSPL